MASHIERRKFLAALGGAAAVWPLAARAEQRAIRVVGFLHTSTPPEYARLAFIQGLSEAGYSEGQNIAIVYRFGESRPEWLTDLANDLIQRRVEVIVTSGGSLAAQAAKKLGLVTSLAKPGGNLTGINLLSGELAAKRLELVRELVPGAARVAVLVNPANLSTTETTLRDVEAAARAMGLQIQVLKASTSHEIDAVFATLARERSDILFVGGDPFFTSRRVQLAILAAHYSIPSTSGTREIAEAGGLMSYGANIPDGWRQAGAYVGRILNGAKPADLPVVQPTKLELVINAQTAKTLGLTVPPTLLATADEVIE
jgi:ABC-type uncharacterized transport system substrate-binding protein